MADSPENSPPEPPPPPDSSSSPPTESSSSPPPSPPPKSTPPAPPPDEDKPSSPPPSSPPPANKQNAPPPSSPPPSSPPPSQLNSPPPSQLKSPPPSQLKSPPLSSPPPSQGSSPSPPPLSPPPTEENPSPSPPLQGNSSPSPPSSDGSVSPSQPLPKPSPNQSPQPPVNIPPSNGSNENDNNNNDRGNSNDIGNSNNNNNSGWFSPTPPVEHKSPSQDNPSPKQSLGPPPSGGGSKSSNNNDSPNIPGVVGVALGAALLLVVMMLLCVCCCKKKKKKPSVDQMQYYNNGPFVPGKGGQQQYYQHDYVVNVNVPPPPGGTNWGHPPATSPTPPPGGTWGHTTPPPPHASGSTDSSSFSGPQGSSHPNHHMNIGFNQSSFTYDELAAATKGFSHSIGQGGFGYVHKGVLPNGKEVAVKSLKTGSGQGEREFQAEVEIISRVHHRHLVSLVGYCIAGEQRMLVYEFLPNDTLEFHLHGAGRPVMDWPSRMKIAVGSAKGLAYLHEDCHPRIIHRDIKASNILLDQSFEAKVADFGLAKLSQDNHTHVSTRVMGTFGYLAPEYASTGKLSDKSDVFSFGVMLLELVTGRRPFDPKAVMEDGLVDWARPLCLKAAEDGDYSELVDPRLGNNYDQREMACMAACGAAAIRHSARRRPKMSQIVRALEGDMSLDALNEGVKPGQSTQFVSISTETSEYDASTYSADMKKFRKLALDSQEYPSSEYGTNTSEYGVRPSVSTSEEMPKGSRLQHTSLHQ